MNNTVRTHPRTSLDAFKGPEYGAAIEHFPRPGPKVWVFVYVAAMVMLVYAIAYVSAP